MINFYYTLTTQLFFTKLKKKKGPKTTLTTDIYWQKERFLLFYLFDPRLI